MPSSQNQQPTGRVEKTAFWGESQREMSGGGNSGSGKQTHGEGRHSAGNNPLRGNFPGKGKEKGERKRIIPQKHPFIPQIHRSTKLSPNLHMFHNNPFFLLQRSITMLRCCDERITTMINHPKRR